MPDIGLSFDVVLDARLELGEGPLWDEATQRLWCVDILRGDIHRFDPDSDLHESFHADRMIGALAVHDDSLVLIATERGFETWNPGVDEPRLIAAVESDDHATRMNDGKVDQNGEMWAGTMRMNGDGPAGSLYRLNRSGVAQQMIPDLQLSNGLGWTPDGSGLYVIDSLRQIVTRYGLSKEGEPREPTVIIDTAGLSGVPDGLAVDAEGSLWVCFWGGGCVRRFDPAGRMILELALPVTNPTSCAFGGADLDRLFVTSSRLELSDHELTLQPLAGCVLEVDPGTCGMTSTMWAGPHHVADQSLDETVRPEQR